MESADVIMASRYPLIERAKMELSHWRALRYDHRVFFDPKGETTIEITAGRNRREAYR